MNRKITVIVVTWNSSKMIPALTRTLRGIGSLCDIVISDNASDDSTVEDISELLPEARIVRNRVNGGFGYGNNRGFEICDSEYVLLLNSDASITRSSLERLLSTLEADPCAAGVQPLIRLWDWPLVTLSAGAAMTEYGRGYDFDFMHFQPFPDRNTVEVPCITAALSLYRMEALKAAGGFDENIFMYYEDVDLCLRLKGMGYRLLLDPDSIASHMMGASSRRKAAEEWELQSSAYIVRKYLGGEKCGLPDYWRRTEFRTRLSCIRKARPWLWRPAALRRVRRMKISHSDLPEEFLLHLLAPRPLRMPHPRPDNMSGEPFPMSDVTTGPGWRGRNVDSCGFGCLKVPGTEGILTLGIRSCNIPGSVALWSNEGYLARVFLNAQRKQEIITKVDGGVTGLYLVPDRIEQIVELENVRYI